MNVSSISINPSISNANSIKNRPSFKSKLMLSPTRLEEMDLESDKTNDKKAMYLLQKAIKKFMAMPEDEVYLMTTNEYSKGGEYVVMSNTSNGKYEDMFDSELDKISENKYINAFINFVLPKEEREVTDAEIRENLNRAHGTIKNCGDMFKKHKNKFLQKEFFTGDYVPISCRPWSEIRKDTATPYMVQGMIERGKLEVVDKRKVEETGRTLYYDTNHIMHDGRYASHYETNCGWGEYWKLSNGGTIYMDYGHTPTSYEGNDPRIKQ